MYLNDKKNEKSLKKKKRKEKKPQRPRVVLLAAVKVALS